MLNSSKKYLEASPFLLPIGEKEGYEEDLYSCIHTRDKF